jgi:hypothetical protein
MSAPQQLRRYRVRQAANDEEKFTPEGAYDFGGSGEMSSCAPIIMADTNKPPGRLSLQELSNGNRLIGAFAAFKNEPFENVAQAQVTQWAIDRSRMRFLPLLPDAALATLPAKARRCGIAAVESL